MSWYRDDEFEGMFELDETDDGRTPLLATSLDVHTPKGQPATLTLDKTGINVVKTGILKRKRTSKVCADKG